MNPDAGSSGESSETEPAEPGTGRDFLAAKPEAAPPSEPAADNTTALIIPEIIPAPAPPPKPPAAGKPADDGGSGRGSSVELLDTMGFPMGEYRAMLIERVTSRWRALNLGNVLGRTAVVFDIDRNGRVSGLRVGTSSGNNSLDIAALSTIKDAAPFPPLPEGFPRERVGVRLILVSD